MSHPNWLEIRAVYESGGVGYRGLAERFRIGVATVARRARREAWQARQGEVNAAMKASAIQAASEAGKEIGLSVAKLETKSLSLVEKLLERIDTELNKADLDAGEIRSLTGAVKEAVSVGRLTHRLDEARVEVPLVRGALLAQLAQEINQQRELKRAAEAGEVIDVTPSPSPLPEAEPGS